MFYSSFSKSLFVCLLFSIILLNTKINFAQSKTEGELLSKIIYSLQHTDTLAYANVFLSADSMANIILRKAPATSEAYQYSLSLKSNPKALMEKDSLIKEQAKILFAKVAERGTRLDIHWDAILISRYELVQLSKTRNATLEAITPERFVGYVFVKDMLSTAHYALSLSDMMKIDGKWYGGELNYIFEANTKEEFNEKVKAEKKRIMRGIPDTIGHYADSIRRIEAKESEEISMKRKQIVDRKLYLGYLDNEIPVDLYIRFLKGDCPEKICTWEAIMKFGENEFLRQEVSKNAEGKWVFTEDVVGGVLEMSLKGKIFEGIFLETNDRIDYEAYLEEKPLSKKKMQKLDAIIERDMVR